MIQAIGSGKPVQIKTVVDTGPRISEKDIARWNKVTDICEKQEGEIRQIQNDLNGLKSVKDNV